MGEYAFHMLSCWVFLKASGTYNSGLIYCYYKIFGQVVTVTEHSSADNCIPY